ncbi:MAG TPA: CocE/NonD family hydrolase [Streptosporangiaceae bacterium]|nr:CocE/NonD family hydrolase [Streptosporangiaceae bacterium]
MRIIIDKNVTVPMRDGVVLAADVYRPDGAGPFPTLVMRLPYNKEAGRYLVSYFDIFRGAQAGYAIVIQDTRGRWASGGQFTPFSDEARDGADTIGWAAAQPWSTGAVGMIGGSYFGATQWTAATETPGVLRAIAPMVTTDQYYDGWAYQGGAFQLGFNLHWTLSSLAVGEVMRRMGAGHASGQASGQDFAVLAAAIDGNDELYRRLPLRGLAELRELAPYYDEWLSHPSYDDFWRATAPRESYDRITVPALNIGAWHDLFLQGTLANYTGMKAHGGSEAARQRQRLVIGPWAHGAMSGWFPERSYGLMSGIDTADITRLQLRWFDWLLKGEDTGLAAEKPVRLFVMGANQWRDEDDWPLPDTEYVSYFLHSGGLANTAGGDGCLSADAPGDEPEDVYLYDPRDPVPTTGGATFLPGLFIGANAGPRDQRSVEARRDVLCYTTGPLAEPLEVIGPVAAVLHVSSSAPDTDFTAKLVDVAPDGRAENLADGIVRARYRESLAEPSLLEPGRTYEITIDLVATAAVFGAGHRIRLEVSSSNFPRFDRNTNTGGVIATEGESDLRQAVNRVHHARATPSRLILPVIRR